jgi:hypothetical protein
MCGNKDKHYIALKMDAIRKENRPTTKESKNEAAAAQHTVPSAVSTDQQQAEVTVTKDETEQ